MQRGTILLRGGLATVLELRQQAWHEHIELTGSAQCFMQFSARHVNVACANVNKHGVVHCVQTGFSAGQQHCMLLRYIPIQGWSWLFNLIFLQ